MLDNYSLNILFYDLRGLDRTENLVLIVRKNSNYFRIFVNLIYAFLHRNSNLNFFKYDENEDIEESVIDCDDIDLEVKMGSFSFLEDFFLRGLNFPLLSKNFYFISFENEQVFLKFLSFSFYKNAWRFKYLSLLYIFYKNCLFDIKLFFFFKSSLASNSSLECVLNLNDFNKYTNLIKFFTNFVLNFYTYLRIFQIKKEFVL